MYIVIMNHVKKNKSKIKTNAMFKDMNEARSFLAKLYFDTYMKMSKNVVHTENEDDYRCLDLSDGSCIEFILTHAATPAPALTGKELFQILGLVRNMLSYYPAESVKVVKDEDMLNIVFDNNGNVFLLKKDAAPFDRQIADRLIEELDVLGVGHAW